MQAPEVSSLLRAVLGLKGALMRTIFVFPRASREETVRRLDGFAPTRTLPNLEAEWVLDDVVWIRLRDNADAGLFDDWDPGMVDALAKAQGGVVAPWALIADCCRGTAEACAWIWALRLR